MSRTNTTYILGAGASYGTVPIVEEIPDALRSLGETIKSDGFYDSYAPVSIRLVELLPAIAEKAETFRTLDSYAQYLSQVGVDDAITLQGLKDVYALVIAYSQIGKQPHNRYTEMWIRLYRSLRKTGEHLESSASFLTWNYDLQLELSYMSLYERESTFVGTTMKRLRSYPSNWQSHGVPGQLNICHINGIAGLYSDRNGRSNEFVTSRVSQATDETKIATLFRYLRERGHDNNENIRFYWEKSELQDKLIQDAKSVIANSKEIIVIGYSFPVENRAFDSEIFRGIRPNTQLVIQDPNPNKGEIERLIPRAISHSVRVRYMTDVRSFYVPDEFL